MESSPCIVSNTVSLTPNTSGTFDIPPPTPGVPPKRQALLDAHALLCLKARYLMSIKNADYSTEDDPYKNFREFGRYGILVRLSDKFQRLKNFEANGRLAVSDESVEDTILDALNYLILFLTFEEKQ